ncbi:MAG: hypothetical protein O2887_13015, partial [Bacteroidetes bacterium]|nr:hypothetical protein [Bacteroidota bacterium]
YIVYPKENLEELYDHRNDQGERLNLAYDPSYLEQLDAMRTEIKKWININIPEGKAQVPKGYQLVDGKTIAKMNFKVIK